MLWSFFLGIVLVVALLLIARWYVQADPKALVRLIKWLAFGIAVGTILALLLTGRLGWAFAALPILSAWFLRLRSLYHLGKVFQRMTGFGASAGPQTSEVETRFLHMILDHGSGTMTGTVREGEFAGHPLDGLELADLLRLHAECRADPQSLQVLEAYLDRMRPDWRQKPEGEDGPTTFSDAMTPEEAYRVLGLEPGASDEAVKEAHRRLIAGLHPDHGGSSFLAAKVNQAKDLLLKGKR